MGCGCHGQASGALTSAEVADAGRFEVTTADGETHRFEHYREAVAFRSERGGRLAAVPRQGAVA